MISGFAINDGERHQHPPEKSEMMDRKSSGSKARVCEVAKQ